MNPAKLAAACRVPVVAITEILNASESEAADPALSLNGDVASAESAWLSRIAQRIRLGRCRANGIASPS